MTVVLLKKIITKKVGSNTIIYVHLTMTFPQNRGDKLSPRNAQKCTIGNIVPDRYLPYCVYNGMIPDGYSSPTCIPTRMTPSSFIEGVVGVDASDRGVIHQYNAYDRIITDDTIEQIVMC